MQEDTILFLLFFILFVQYFPSNFRDKFCLNMALGKVHLSQYMKASHAKIFIDNVSCLVCTTSLIILCTEYYYMCT